MRAFRISVPIIKLLDSGDPFYSTAISNPNTISNANS